MSANNASGGCTYSDLRGITECSSPFLPRRRAGGLLRRLVRPLPNAGAGDGAAGGAVRRQSQNRQMQCGPGP